MSRIGKKPIVLPKGVTAKVNDDAVEVQGPKGKLRQAIPPGVKFAQEDGSLVASLVRADKELAYTTLDAPRHRGAGGTGKMPTTW